MEQKNELKWVTAACTLDGTIDIAPEHLYELGVAA